MVRRIVALGVAQVAAIAAVAAYATAAPLVPDSGLEQIDLVSLHQRVPGVGAVAGKPTLYLAPGLTTDPKCAAALSRYLRSRDTPTGLPNRFGLVVIADGTVVRRLALPRAAAGCHPGYALVDGRGFVRYRTYDGGYPDHTGEQAILLDALR